jgi:hypothetical protein
MMHVMAGPGQPEPGNWPVPDLVHNLVHGAP